MRLDLALNFIDIRSFGAVGDGIADSTSEIQAAINYGNTNLVPVYIPAGVYIISEPLLVKSKSVLFGVGNNSILKLKDSTQINIITVSLTDVIDDFEICHFAIDGNIANQTDGGSVKNQNGIHIEQTGTVNLTYFNIHNMYIHSNKKSGVYVGKHNITGTMKSVKNNYITHNGLAGVYVDDYCEYLNLDSNNLYDNVGYGYYSLGSNNNITGGIIKGYSDSYAIYAEDARNLSKMIVSGVNMNHTRGLYFKDASNININGCQIFASGMDGIKLENCNECVISNNQISANGQLTTDTYSEIAFIGSVNNIVSNNVLSAYATEKTKYGFSLDANSDNNIFSYNKPLNNATAPYIDSGSGNVII